MKNENIIVNKLNSLTNDMYSLQHPYLICTDLIKGDLTPIIDIFSKMNDISDISEFNNLYLNYIKTNNIQAYKAHMQALDAVYNSMLILDIVIDITSSIHHIQHIGFILYVIGKENKNVICSIYTKQTLIHIKYLEYNIIIHERFFGFNEFEKLSRIAKLKYIESL